MQRCFFIAICALFAACNPYERDIKHWEQLVEQAERIELSAPSAAYLLLDSVEYPVLLSDEWLTRYCVLVCQLADSIHVPLPHEDELDRALYYLEQHGEPIEQARMGFYWGRALQEEGLQRPAMEAFKKAEVRSRTIGDLHLTARICREIGILYGEQADYHSARDWMEESLKLFQQTDDKSNLGKAWRLLGKEYASLDSFDLAMDCMLHADSIIQAFGDSVDISTIYNNIGNVYLMFGQLEKAKSYLKLSITFDPDDSAPTCSALGHLYLKEDSLKQAEYYLNEARKPTSNPDTHEELIYHFAKLEQKKGNWAAAIDSMDSYIDHWEKYILQLRETNLAEANALFDRKQMTKENIRLKKVGEARKVGLLWLGIFCLTIFTGSLYWIKRKNDQLHHILRELVDQKSALLEKEELLQRYERELKEHKQKYEQAQQNLVKQETPEYIQIQQTYEAAQTEVVELRKQVQAKNLLMLSNTMIYKKVMRLARQAKPGSEILSEEDKTNIQKAIDRICPSMKAELVRKNLTPTETICSYFSFFKLDNNCEAILLDKEVSAIEKYHTRIRHKLGFPKEKGSICDYFAGF